MKAPTHLAIALSAALGVAACGAAAQDAPAPTPAAEAGAPFTVNGEQLALPIPKFWKLAWMEGAADADYVAEYIPEDEDINSWRGGYLQISRAAYPPADVLARLAEARVNISDMALAQHVSTAARHCGGRHEAMQAQALTYNGIRLALGGGFCDQYGPAAPFGEGAYIAFVEGKDYMFRLHYGWRPRTPAERASYLPWRLAPAADAYFQDALKAATLCGGKDQPPCA